MVLVDPYICEKKSVDHYSGKFDAYTKGKAKDIFMKSNLTGKSLVGCGWCGKSFYVDFNHPKAQSYWTDQITKLHNNYPIDGVWY